MTVYINGVEQVVAHKTKHQDTGADEISIASLSGEPATLTTHKDLATGIHGVGAGTLVGTTLTQTLTNKTLTSPTINGTIATTGLTMPAFILGGNITGGANKIIFGNGGVGSGPWADYLQILDDAGTGVGSIYCKIAELTDSLFLDTSGKRIAAPNSDDAYIILQARINTSGMGEIGKFLGAVDPEFQLGNGGNALRASNAGKLGFFATAPQTRPAHIDNSAGDDATAVNAIIAALETLGLVASL